MTISTTTREELGGQRLLDALCLVTYALWQIKMCIKSIQRTPCSLTKDWVLLFLLAFSKF